jgi:uncharacterized Zn finger protein
MAPPTTAEPPWDGPFPPGRRIAGDGIRARSRRGAFATTWWGRRFVDAVEEVAGAGRVARGRTYARAGQVLSLDVGAGRVRSSVQGSRSTPYVTELRFHTWDAETQRELAEAVAGSPSVLAAVLGGRMPEGFEQLTLSAGLALFPESLADARFDCTCPDWGDPCKHAAAVVYLLAEWLDAEPFGVLTLRGVERDALLAQVAALQRSSAGESAEAVAEADLADGPGPFYGRAAPLPAMGASVLTGAAVLDDLDASLLGPGGGRAVERLRGAYAAMEAARGPQAPAG